MNKRQTYALFMLTVVALLACSCGKRLNKRVTLWRNDKIPYGTYYAYENLNHVFEKARVSVSASSPTDFYDEKHSSAYIIISPRVRPSDAELKAILSHAINGNHIFISALDIGKNVLDSFKLKVQQDTDYFSDSLNVSLDDPEGPYTLKYGYPGARLSSHISSMDSNVTNILGRDDHGNANFVKFTYQGGGTVALHLAPAAFTNFFLLHKNNKKYYDIAMSSMPDTVSEVKWDDYFRRHTNGEDNASRSAFSKLGAFLSNETLRWAFWLTILLFAIVYLFESKRKQRVVPVVSKLNNTSLDFVKTIGRLYFQRKDNKNLAQKMSTHLLGRIRSRYNLQTSQLDDDFCRKLAFKSGYSFERVKMLVEDIKNIEDAYEVTDEQLMAYNDKIDTFINKA